MDPAWSGRVGCLADVVAHRMNTSKFHEKLYIERHIMTGIGNVEKLVYWYILLVLNLRYFLHITKGCYFLKACSTPVISSLQKPSYTVLSWFIKTFTLLNAYCLACWLMLHVPKHSPEASLYFQIRRVIYSIFVLIQVCFRNITCPFLIVHFLPQSKLNSFAGTR